MFLDQLVHRRRAQGLRIHGDGFEPQSLQLGGLHRFARPCAEDHHNRQISDATRKERGEAKGRAIRPLSVVDDEKNRLCCSEVGDEPVETVYRRERVGCRLGSTRIWRAEGSTGLTGAAGQPGRSLLFGCSFDQRLEQLARDTEGHVAFHLPATCFPDEEASVVTKLRRLSQKSGLADPRRTLDEEQGASPLAGGSNCFFYELELAFSFEKRRDAVVPRGRRACYRQSRPPDKTRCDPHPSDGRISGRLAGEEQQETRCVHCKYCATVREMAKSEPFSLRLSPTMETLVREEARRTRRSKGAVVEALAEEALKTRLFPGIAFRGADWERRAWVIGTALDVWQIVDAHRDFGSVEKMTADSDLTERQMRLALAYYERFPQEIDEMIELNRATLDELRIRFPTIDQPSAASD